MKNSTRRKFIKTMAGASAGLFSFSFLPELFAGVSDKNPPNIIIIFPDDMGYGDIGCFGNPVIRTPNLDKMASEGTKFTQFYVAASVCTPSRAALLTGCYPKRVGLHKKVLYPHTETGLHPDETTLAEILKKRGYSTACVGKWHLGHHKKFLPGRQGFDHFYGIPYSNDMSEKEQKLLGNNNYPYKLPLMKNEEVLEVEPDQSRFTREFTEDAVKFINRNKNNPFFLYLAHPMPHIPIYASEDFKDKSIRGKYGDTIEEIDWSVGEVRKALESNDISNNTLVIFTSDNGPWLRFKANGGSAGPFRGGKATTFEGGMRVPCIMAWPGIIPAGEVCTGLTTAMDIYPTVASITGSRIPGDTKIDGKNINQLLENPKTGRSPNDTFYYYSNLGELEAVRKGKWKYNIKHNSLYDLNTDIGEKRNISDKHPDLVYELKSKMLKFDEQLEKEARPAGTL